MLLENGVESLQSPPHASAFIIDAMALLQTLTRVPDRFAGLADLVLRTIIEQVGKATRIDFVADK